MRMEGRKLPPSMENPVDHYIISFAEWTNPFFYNMRLTPNILTMISFVIGIGAAFAIYYQHYILGGLLFFVSYIFDCMDGNYARKYGMVTSFGDWFDHITDIVVYSAICIIIILDTRIPIFWKTWIVFCSIVSFGFVLVVVGCQERFYHNGTQHAVGSSSLQATHSMCPNPTDPAKSLHVWRWFGFGTQVVIFVANIIALHWIKLV